jgi:hypothetical protein
MPFWQFATWQSTGEERLWRTDSQHPTAGSLEQASQRYREDCGDKIGALEGRITHRADMPLVPGGAKFGLGLWNSIAGTMVVEIVMLFAGVSIYARATRARDWIGRYVFWGYVVVLMIFYVGDRFGGPPESMREIAWTGMIATVVMLVWAGWFDAHRTEAEIGK